MTKDIMKHTVQRAMENEYGFRPPLSQITLLEAADDRTYILFSVNKHEYRFTSFISTIGGCETVWVGKGTIEKLS